MVTQPHFLLFCDTHLAESHHSDSMQRTYSSVCSGRWHFVLEQIDGSERLEAADNESAVNRERLSLLSVVRGLEALQQPSQVTLVTTSRYVSRGLRYGLNSWREAGYQWERFGEQRPIRNSDLWRRVDTALQFHGVQCRLIQAGQANDSMTPSADARIEPTIQAAPVLAGNFLEPHARVAQTMGAGAGSGTIVERLEISQLDLQNVVHEGFAHPFATPPNAIPPGRKLVLTLRWPRLLDGQFLRDWWDLAASWLRWKRGRWQTRPAF